MTVAELKELIKDADDDCFVVIRSEQEYWPGKKMPVVHPIHTAEWRSNATEGHKEFLVLE